jgi:hypothetical protein
MAAVEVFKHDEMMKWEMSVDSLLVPIWLLLSGVGIADKIAEKIEGSMLKLDISHVQG